MVLFHHVSVRCGHYIIPEARTGKTLGKHLLGLVVVSEDGSQIGTKTSAIRNLLRVVDAFPTLYLVGFLPMYNNTKQQRLGDIIAATVVVKQAPATAGSTGQGVQNTVTDSQTGAGDVEGLIRNN